MNSAGATDAVAAFGDYARFHADLPARTLELVIMRTATVLRDQYMRAHHAKLAVASGLSADGLAAIARPPATEGGWTARRRTRTR